ncbi:hypothetical protein SteCoe_26080 [Stentor coeruleus]|uniref:CHY-type domain-containing protein n=1 Tax=Stentor coeruleus TaxID=5963 RepID=A0A1R2BDR1_9CILI|nr:hypothetical protein SteCoe_26080 [Stentor coeruleus]
MESSDLLFILQGLLSNLSINDSKNLINCSVFENISYFMVYLCCGKLYCCDTCHKKAEGHNPLSSGYMLCNDCDGLQPLRNEPNNCACCGSYHPALIKKNLGNNQNAKITLKCTNFSNISYWMVYECCNNLYCCRTCHQKDQNHEAPKSKKMVCFDCGTIQPLRNEPNNCSSCNSYHPALVSGVSTSVPSGFIKCSVYSNIAYFMIYPCCGNLYCCNVCHNNSESHPHQGCSEMICLYCGGRQPLRNEPNNCSICRVNHPALVGKTATNNSQQNSLSLTQGRAKKILKCKRYSNSSYWMIFPCCNNLYCCGNCHNEEQDHNALKCSEMVCFDCGGKQALRFEPNNCSACNSFHSALTSGNTLRVPNCYLPCNTYNNISYFMIFPCCNKLYCCTVCHNNKETHQTVKCLKMVCLWCGGKQDLKNEPNRCAVCNREHPALVSRSAKNRIN